MTDDPHWRRDTIVKALQDLLHLPGRREPPAPRDPLQEVTASDPALDRMDTFRGPRWLPIKVQIGLGLAGVGFIKGTISGGPIGGLLAALAVLLFTAVIWVIDVFITRHRRANRRRPKDFGSSRAP